QKGKRIAKGSPRGAHDNRMKEERMKSFLGMCAFAAVLAAAPAFAVDPHDADNSGKNVRDRDDRTVTPMDQGGSAEDRELTAAIRREIVKDDSLSMDAHNVKIV